MPLSVVIVDDERVARARLRRLLSNETDVQIVAECADGRSAVAAILEHRPDLVFLDIQMPELNGFQVLDTLPGDAIPNFIFVTAYEQYALDAFAVEALDYLLKPFDAERLQTALARARRRIGDNNERRPLLDAIRQLAESQREIQASVAQLAAGNGGGSTAVDPIERLPIRSDGCVSFVKVSDVDYFESAANYVNVHVGTQIYRARERMRELETRLDPKRFARIHRATIVNIDRIREVQPWFSGDAVVIMRDGQKLRLSRSYRNVLPL
ncbi:MAG: LytTR family DNA-binding domain-containing protein [bacterium]